MEYEKLFNDSIEYTRETFTGHWVRWLIFILLGLPFALMRFVVDPRKIMTGSTIHWEMIPWGSIAVLVIIGFLASLFISGYIVRIYRGTRPAPDFTGWAALFIDGIKVDIVMFAWFLPALIVLLAELALGLGMITTARFTANPGTIVLMILLIPVELILLLIAIFYMTMGAVRFARTGSMAEGWRFSAISAILRRIGWWNYLIAVILLAVAGLFFNLVVSVPAVIPYVGWIVPVVLSPLLTVFAGRYFTLVYEAGEAPPPPAPVP
jgi:hypothetical protein